MLAESPCRIKEKEYHTGKRKTAMNRWNLYRMFLTFLFTIVLVRLGIGFLQLSGIDRTVMIGGFAWHHFYTGMVLILFAHFAVRRNHTAGALLTGVGWGLVADEITYPLYLLGFSQFTYWYFGSILAVLFVIIVVAWKALLKAPITR